MAGQRVRTRLLWGLAAGLVALLGLELAHRLWLYGPAGLSPARLASVRPIGESDLVEPDDDPRVGYRLKPGYSGWFQLQRFTTNAQGRREPERGRRSGDVRRIVALGDSYTMGSGVADGEPWPARLERSMGEVLNFGVGGYGLLHQLALLERVFEHDPDLIVVGLTWNDVEPPPMAYFERLAGKQASPPGPAPAPPFLRWTLLDRCVRRPVRSQPPADEAVAFGYLRSLAMTGPGEDYVSLAISAIARRCQDADVPVLFAFLSTGPGEPGAEAAARFEAAALAAGADFVDTRPRLADLSRGGLIVRPDDGHPNARAHALYAEALAQKIESGVAFSRITR